MSRSAAPAAAAAAAPAGSAPLVVPKRCFLLESPSPSESHRPDERVLCLLASTSFLPCFCLARLRKCLCCLQALCCLHPGRRSMAQEPEEKQQVALDVASEDYETLSPFPLSPYQLGATPSSNGALTPQTPVASSPFLPYIPVAFEDFVHAQQILGGTTSTREKSQPSQGQEAVKKQFPAVLENMSLLAHLATFGIIGVLIRYWLGELFDRIGHVTSTQSALFHDLPANMFGCYFMGWVGLALKSDIAQFSELLALGLSTGLMGSITTFSSWMVKLVALMADGHWLPGLVGFLIGTHLALGSLIMGMHSAMGFKWLVQKLDLRCKVAPDNRSRKMWSLVLFLPASICLWTLFLALTLLDKQQLERRRLWLACVLGPPGVWMRWWLSKHNGKGIQLRSSSPATLAWIPWGTLSANTIACLIGFVLSTTQIAVKGYHTLLWCGAIQLGTLGCLSTVSTLVVEVYKLHNSGIIWRAYTYIIISIVSAFILGISFYASVVWARDYH